jgi:hypothetical protein
MDIICDKKFINQAKNLLNKFDLIIGGHSYDIISVAIHINDNIDRRNSDPLVNLKGRHKNTWYIFSENYNEYIDFDLSEGNNVGGIRINTIKRKDSGVIYATAGDIYKHIKSMLGGAKYLNELNGISPDKKSSSDFYLKRKKEIENNFLYYLPRFGNYKKIKNANENNLRYLFVTHMLTKNLDWIPKRNYTQNVVLCLYLYLVGKEKFLIQNKLISEKLLSKYIRQSFMISTNSPSKIYRESPDSGLGVYQICQLFGNYCVKYHDIEKALKNIKDNE